MTGLAALALLGAVVAPRPAAVADDSTRGAGLRVYLLTFDSGARIWERFGHNALWIHDPVDGTDWAYDYGRFAFDRGFIRRFARGDLRYWMGDGDVRSYLAAYQQAGRRIWSQELALPPAAKAEMQRFLRWNLREENRYYAYDYYRDNCSTRIRDVIDRAVGGALRRYGDSIRSPLTYRQQTRRLTENNPALYTALMIGLGQPVDRPATAWEAMFLPIELRPHLNRLRVPGPDGALRPLVAEERLLFDSDRFPVPDRPSTWTAWFLAIGLLLGAALGWTGWRGGRSRSMRRLFLAVAAGWASLTGAAGALLIYLWMFTDHRFSVANENVLQFTLVSLVLAPLLVARGGPSRLAVGLAGAAAGLSALGLGLKLVPAFGQANAEVIAMALPAHLGVWAGLLALTRRGAG